MDLAILDDDPDFCNYLEDALKDDGLYSIRAFGHPDELFAACEQRLPDIVLLDMKMGEFKGDKVLEQLLAAYPGLCVIIVTGYPSLEDMRATFKMKVFDYISKPFSLAQLRQTLHNAIDKYGFGRTAQDRLRERLGHQIKMLRVERDWSLKDLAAATKLSISQISSIERGANLPSIESLLAICRAFDKRPSEVLVGHRILSGRCVAPPKPLALVRAFDASPEEEKSRELILALLEFTASAVFARSVSSRPHHLHGRRAASQRPAVPADASSSASALAASWRPRGGERCHLG